MACLRIGISCLCSFPLAIKGIRTVNKSKLPLLLAIGLFGTGIPAFLFPLSMTHSDSSVNGILNSLSPLWTLVIGYYLFKVNITRQKLLGVLIGFAGALVLVLGKTGGNLRLDVFYSFLPVIATFCYGMSSNLTKQKLQNENAAHATSIAMAMIGLPALIILSFTAAPAKIVAGTVWLSLAAITTLSIFGTLIAWILFYRLVQRTDALFAASVTYLVPIVAIGWGVLDGEVLNLIQLLGFAFIITGVYYTTRPAKLKAKQ